MDRPVFFIHITKTGGQTIEKVLQDAFDSVYIFDHDRDCATVPSGYQAYSGQVPWYTVHNFEHTPWTFTFLRNPIDRLISFYNYYRTHDLRTVQWVYRDGRKRWSRAIKSDLPLGDFLSQPGMERIANNRLTRDLGAEEPLIHDYPGHRCVMRAMKVIDDLSFIGLFENFQKSLLQLSSYLGHELAEVPKVNSVPYIVPRKMFDYNKTDRAKLIEFTKYDSIVYNYAVKRYMKEFL